MNLRRSSRSTRFTRASRIDFNDGRHGGSRRWLRRLKVLFLLGVIILGVLVGLRGCDQDPVKPVVRYERLYPPTPAAE
ncbi:MAG: hypothetical protein HQL50_10030 [Magnetococcales bacterium]|nr:hypothetical protein [Magnetococcales bacterium]